MASIVSYTQIVTAPNLTEHNTNKSICEERYGVGGTMEGQWTYEYDDENLKITFTKTLPNIVYA